MAVITKTPAGDPAEFETVDELPAVVPAEMAAYSDAQLSNALVELTDMNKAVDADKSRKWDFFGMFDIIRDKIGFLAADRTKLDSITVGDIRDLETLQDTVAAMLQGGTHTNVVINYDDANGTIGITASGGGGGGLDQEQVEDIVGALTVQGTGITAFYDDPNGQLVISLAGESYTTAEKNKLAGIESNATADQTGAEIKAAYEAETNTNAFTDTEKAKLAGIEASATADQTPAEIKAAYESNGDTNAFTDSEKTKLAAIDAAHYGAPLQTTVELSALAEAALTDKERRYVEDELSDYFYDAAAATGDVAPDDQTGGTGFWKKVAVDGETPASIKTKYESNADTNAYTDTEQTKLAGIAANAQVNVIEDVEPYAADDTTPLAWFSTTMVGKVIRLGLQLFGLNNTWTGNQTFNGNDVHDGTNTYPGKHIAGTTELTPAAGALTVDLSTKLPYKIKIPLTANLTNLAVVNGVEGQEHEFIFDNSGTFTVNWAGVAGTAPDVNPSGGDDDGLTSIWVTHFGAKGLRFGSK